jgi:hypothetical protein
MSLAMYASPFDSESSNDVSNTYSTASKRRNINNRTQKRQEEPSYSASKVNSVLNAIHKSTDSPLSDFKPLAPPVSAGVENTRINNPDSSNTEDDIDLQNLNSTHMNEQASAQYYKQFMPAYQQSQSQLPPTQPPQNQHHHHMKDNTNVIAKLNYMIHLLEEQKDERTNNVTEEVVLYSFLGIFVIFIVDSFVRVGKYVR